MTTSWTPPPDMPVNLDRAKGQAKHVSFKFEAELLGGHVHVKVRAATRHTSVQVDHSRGLCGELVMAPGEWLLFRHTLLTAYEHEPVWVRDGGRAQVFVPAGPDYSYHDGQRFIKITGWPEPDDVGELERLRLADVQAGSGRCRVCGCTQNYGCPGGCSWVKPDWCSACAVPAAPRQSPEPAAKP